MSINANNAALNEILETINNLPSADGLSGGTEELKNIIDESGVLDSTEGTVTEKVERLIDLAEWEKAWYKQTENMTTVQRLFFRFGVGEDIPNGYPTIPRTNLINCTNFASFCENANIEYVDYLIESKAEYFSTDRMFFGCNAKRIAGVKGKILSAISMFHTSSIEEIVEPLDFSAMNGQKTANAFNCSKLREVRFVAESIKWSIAFTSAVLSIGNVFDLTDTENVGSVQSIINGLATLAEGATAQTLTLSKNLPLTEEQKQAITTAVNNKGWTLAFA